MININSVTGKAPQLANLISYTDPDALLITETKLDSLINNAEFMPEQYACLRRDRIRGGGGVLIAIKKKFAPEEVQLEDVNGEVIWASVSFRSQRKLYLGAFYRPPDNKLDGLEALNNSLNIIMEKTRNNTNSTVIVGGDFNAPDINWSTSTVDLETRRKPLHERLLAITNDHHLTQLQLEPTRENNILDLFLTNKPGCVKNIATLPGISDHTGIILTDCDIRPTYIKSKPRQVPMFSRANWDAMKQETLKFQEEFVTSCPDKDINTAWSDFKSHIDTIISKHVPSKTTSKRYTPPWLTGPLKRMCAKEHRIHNRYQKTGKAKFKVRARKLKRENEKAIKKAHWEYVNNILTESLVSNNSKPFWKYIKSKRQENIGIAPLLKDGKLHSDSTEKANILNTQFQSVFTQDDGSLIPRLQGESYPDIDNLTITTPGVQKLLEKINPQKASGPDNIPDRVLKELAPEIAPCLTAIFNKSLDTGQLPDTWTQANVTPIYKKGNKHAAENYRPVSLTCICAKLMEHIICHHIANHLEANSILTPYQHGFRQQRSCETQLLSTVHDLMRFRDQNLQTDVAVLDFSKAFDTVPHRSLLGKLEHYGIKGNIHLWITNFLTTRKQCVLVEGAQSDNINVDSGVPQGTVLGPILFLLHINDLPDNVSSRVRLFADDCLLYRPIKSNEDQLALQADLDSLSRWCTTWGMNFNAKKCNILSISRSRTPFSMLYTIGGQVLEHVNSAKYLGVTITNELSWSQHITSTANKANSSLGFLRRNLRLCPAKLKETAYFSLVRSVLEYSAAIWDPHLIKDVNRLEMVQRRAARFVKNDYVYDSSVTTMLKELGWQDLQSRRKELRLALFFKIVHGLVAVPVDDPNILQVADSRTRAQHQFKYKNIRANTNAFKFSFFVRTTPDWNNIPFNLSDCKTAETFKSRLKTA